MNGPDLQPSITRRHLLGTGLVAAAGLAGCTMPTTMTSETTSKSIAVDDATGLAVETQNGNITVGNGDAQQTTTQARGGQITVDATKRTSGDEETLQQIHVVSSRSGGTITVGVDRSNVPRHVTVSVDLDVTVPDGLAVQRATTTNGDVTAREVSGDGSYRTENGDLDVKRVDGYLTLHSTNGDVDASNVSGIDGATTTNGDIDVGFSALRTDASATSVNGDVSLSVPADLNAAVELRTVNGDVTVDGLTLSDRSGGSKSVSGRLGDGSHALTAKTTNGDVTLSALD